MTPPDSKRAIDSLPSRFDPGARPARPRRLLAGAMIVLALALVVVLALIVRSVVGTPSPANADRASDPARTQAALDAAARLMREGDPGAAQACLERAIAACPDEPTLHVALAESLVGQRDFARAHESYLRAIAAGAASPEVYFAAGTVASLGAQPERAIEHYQNAQLGDPLNPAYPLFLAQVQIKAGLAGDARANLVRCVNLDPAESRAWGTLAELDLADNKLDMAVQNAQRARASDPDSARWRLVEAKALKRQGHVDAALDLVLALDASERRDLPTLKFLGECFGMLRQPGEAARLFAEASDAEPLKGDLALEAALWFERAESRERALDFARRARSLGVEGAPELVARLERAGDQPSR